MKPQAEPGYGSYSAEQADGQVTIRATGETPSSGYDVKLEQSMIDVFPPEFVLTWTPPDGLAADMMTPFDVTARFPAEEPVEAVVVRDAEGDHTVMVEEKG